MGYGGSHRSEGTEMNNMLRFILIGFFMVVFGVLTASCSDVKTSRGKVIDADTREPIEGAAVVAYWHKASWIPFGESIVKLKDVKETLTDKNGEWSIQGPAGNNVNSVPYAIALFGLIYYTREPEFIVFKPGYCSWPQGFSISACQGKLKPEGSGKITQGENVELPKLTNREDRIRSQAIYEPAAPGVDRKLREFHRLLNEERRTLGLGEIHY
jgi:hypothetical protein